MKISKKRIKQLYIDGTFKAEFDSPQDAAKSLDKDKRYSPNHIREVCNGKRKTAFGYKWEYCV